MTPAQNQPSVLHLQQPAPTIGIPAQRSDDLPTPTAFDNQRFTVAWPTVANAVTAVLVKRGCRGTECEDITQETALRVLSRQVPFTDAADLSMWAICVAKNLHNSALRHRYLLVDLDHAASTPGPDLSERVENRLALAAALPGLRSLNATDLQSLRSRSDADVRTGNRTRAQRRRVRNRLKKLTGGLIA